MIKLGLIGESNGNGHPFSWSAIVNGYHSLRMKNCGYDSIPEYLSKQDWTIDHVPEAAITHIWTPDLSRSEFIASTCKVVQPVSTIEKLAESADAFIVARDDYVYNYQFALALAPFGKPILFDKQIASSSQEAHSIINFCRLHGSPLFTGSPIALHNLGELKNWVNSSDVRRIVATTPKTWRNYAVHIIDPIMTALKSCNDFLVKYVKSEISNLRKTSVFIYLTRPGLPGLEIEFIADMDNNDGFHFAATGESERIIHKYTLRDPFNCFKSYLNVYVHACLLFRNHEIEEVNRMEKSGIKHYLEIQDIIDKFPSPHHLL